MHCSSEIHISALDLFLYINARMKIGFDTFCNDAKKLQLVSQKNMTVAERFQHGRNCCCGKFLPLTGIVAKNRTFSTVNLGISALDLCLNINAWSKISSQAFCNDLKKLQSVCQKNLTPLQSIEIFQIYIFQGTV